MSAFPKDRQKFSSFTNSLYSCGDRIRYVCSSGPPCILHHARHRTDWMMWNRSTSRCHQSGNVHHFSNLLSSLSATPTVSCPADSSARTRACCQCMGLDLSILQMVFGKQRISPLVIRNREIHSPQGLLPFMALFYGVAYISTSSNHT